MRKWRDKLNTPKISRMTHERNWGDYSRLIDAPTDTKINTLTIQLLTLVFFCKRLRMSQLQGAPSNLDSQKTEALLSFASLETASRIMIMFVPVKILTNILKRFPQTSLTVDERTWCVDAFSELSLDIAHELFD